MLPWFMLPLLEFGIDPVCPELPLLSVLLWEGLEFMEELEFVDDPEFMEPEFVELFCHMPCTFTM